MLSLLWAYVIKQLIRCFALIIDKIKFSKMISQYPGNYILAFFAFDFHGLKKTEAG